MPSASRNRGGVRPRPWVAGALGAAVVLLASEAALAYCRTSVCDGGDSGQRCVPAQIDDCGTELYWKNDCFGFSVHQGASAQVTLTTAEALMQQAFDAWSDAPCAGGGTPVMAVSNLGAVSCDQKEYNQKSGNTNLVVFRDEEWPYAGQGNTLALTTVTYNLDNGEIFDADLEINGTIKLTTGDAGVEFDLLSIMTHEAGHMLGLAHSTENQATMYIQYVPGNTELRSLHPDDVAAICASYPPAAEQESCDPTPRHGFSAVCDPPPPPKEGCQCAAGPAPARPAWWLLGLGLGAAARRARDRRRA